MFGKIWKKDMKIKIEKYVILELDTHEIKQLQDILEFARIYMDERRKSYCIGEDGKKQHAMRLGLLSLQELQNLESFMQELFEI